MPRGERFGGHASSEITRALQYAGEASGLKYAVVVRGRGDRRLAAELTAGLAGTADTAGDAHPIADMTAATDVDNWAEAVHARMVDPPRSVLVAVDTDARAVRIVTGLRARRRLPDRAITAVVATMAQLFATRGLMPGLVTGLQQLGQLAGPPPRRRERTDAPT